MRASFPAPMIREGVWYASSNLGAAKDGPQPSEATDPELAAAFLDLQQEHVSAPMAQPQPVVLSDFHPAVSLEALAADPAMDFLLSPAGQMNLSDIIMTSVDFLSDVHPSGSVEDNHTAQHTTAGSTSYAPPASPSGQAADWNHVGSQQIEGSHLAVARQRQELKQTQAWMQHQLADLQQLDQQQWLQAPCVQWPAGVQLGTSTVAGNLPVAAASSASYAQLSPVQACFWPGTPGLSAPISASAAAVMVSAAAAGVVTPDQSPVETAHGPWTAAVQDAIAAGSLQQQQQQRPGWQCLRPGMTQVGPCKVSAVTAQQIIPRARFNSKRTNRHTTTSSAGKAAKSGSAKAAVDAQQPNKVTGRVRSFVVKVVDLFKGLNISGTHPLAAQQADAPQPGMSALEQQHRLLMPFASPLEHQQQLPVQTQQQRTTGQLPQVAGVQPDSNLDGQQRQQITTSQAAEASSALPCSTTQQAVIRLHSKEITADIKTKKQAIYRAKAIAAADSSKAPPESQPNFHGAGDKALLTMIEETAKELAGHRDRRITLWFQSRLVLLHSSAMRQEQRAGTGAIDSNHGADVASLLNELGVDADIVKANWYRQAQKALLTLQDLYFVQKAVEAEDVQRQQQQGRKRTAQAAKAAPSEYITTGSAESDAEALRLARKRSEESQQFANCIMNKATLESAASEVQHWLDRAGISNKLTQLYPDELLMQLPLSLLNVPEQSFVDTLHKVYLGQTEDDTANTGNDVEPVEMPPQSSAAADNPATTTASPAAAAANMTFNADAAAVSLGLPAYQQLLQQGTCNAEQQLQLMQGLDVTTLPPQQMSALQQPGIVPGFELMGVGQPNAQLLPPWLQDGPAASALQMLPSVNADALQDGGQQQDHVQIALPMQASQQYDLQQLPALLNQHQQHTHGHALACCPVQFQGRDILGQQHVDSQMPDQQLLIGQGFEAAAAVGAVTLADVESSSSRGASSSSHGASTAQAQQGTVAVSAAAADGGRYPLLSSIIGRQPHRHALLKAPYYVRKREDQAGGYVSYSDLQQLFIYTEKEAEQRVLGGRRVAHSCFQRIIRYFYMERWPHKKFVKLRDLLAWVEQNKYPQQDAQLIREMLEFLNEDPTVESEYENVARYTALRKDYYGRFQNGLATRDNASGEGPEGSAGKQIASTDSQSSGAESDGGYAHGSGAQRKARTSNSGRGRGRQAASKTGAGRGGRGKGRHAGRSCQTDSSDSEGSDARPVAGSAARARGAALCRGRGRSRQASSADDAVHEGETGSGTPQEDASIDSVHSRQAADTNAGITAAALTHNGLQKTQVDGGAV